MSMEISCHGGMNLQQSRRTRYNLHLHFNFAQNLHQYLHQCMRNLHRQAHSSAESLLSPLEWCKLMCKLMCKSRCKSQLGVVQKVVQIALGVVQQVVQIALGMVHNLGWCKKSCERGATCTCFCTYMVQKVVQTSCNLHMFLHLHGAT